MAWIAYVEPEGIPPEDRIEDPDNILRIHGVHARTLLLHYDLYGELMYAPGPLSRVRREMIAVTVSALNGCHY